MANVSSFSGAMPVIPGGTVELGYSQIISSVSPSTTGYPAATDVIPAMTVVCDGGPVLVEFWCCYAKPANTADQSLTFTLFVDGAENQRYWGYLQTPASANSYKPVHLMCRLSPSAGSHTFAVKATVSSGTGTIGAGAGGGAVESPAFLRVSKIVNQNDGLKPFWTPPVVTSLPSQATEGDQVLLYSSSPYAGYQTHQYVTGSWRTLDDSRAVGSWQSYTPTWTNLTVGNATQNCAYMKIGKMVVIRYELTWGSTTSSSGTWIMSYPSGLDSRTYVSGSNHLLGQAMLTDAGTGYRMAAALYNNTTSAKFEYLTPSGSVIATSGVNATSPFTWTTNDIISGTLMYEAA